MKVLVLTLSFGSGHVRAAQVVANELARQAPEAEVRVVDALAVCRTLFRAGYVWPYWAMIRFAPALWARFFARRVARKHRHTAPAWAFRWGCARVFQTIAEFNPDVIVSTEVAACELAVLARRAGLTNARIVAVITDHEAEPVWVKPEVDRYAVADETVRAQLRSWGAPAFKIVVSGIPIAPSFDVPHDSKATRAQYGLTQSAPVVLMMGGGKGPTRMDEVAAFLLESGQRMQIVAITGHDNRMRRRLRRLHPLPWVTLRVIGWTDDVAAIMQAATVLITKPGGLTTTEAARCGLPLVMFDAIPGPELRNAERIVETGSGVLVNGARKAAVTALSLLQDEETRQRISAKSELLAPSNAAEMIAHLALNERDSVSRDDREHDVVNSDHEQDNPVLILTISNGAGHIRVAQGIASAIRAETSVPVLIADVADYMTPLARFTHIQAYLWIVKHAPAVWDRIDRYQKKQTHTSPVWFYRSGCRKLFELAGRVRPRAVIATEVGCCEIAALLKRDLALDVPLVAVNDDYDADRAWVQSEVDLYCFVTDRCGEQLIQHGAPRERVRVWGAPLSQGFDVPRERTQERAAVFQWLALDPKRPLVLVAGGGEGLGRIEETTARLLQLKSPAPQLVVLTGHNERLKARCERLARNGESERLRVLGWTGPEQMPQLMSAADLMVSKLGSMFHEALASELPIVALKPPPGSERVQYRLLEEWQVGCPVRTVDQMCATVNDLLANPQKLSAMREQARARRLLDAGPRIARWLKEKMDHQKER